MSGLRALGRIAMPLAWLALWTGGRALADDAEAQANKTAAPPAAVRIGDVRAGIAGQCKVGYWTPFVVELEGGDRELRGHVEIVLADGDGVPSRVRAPQDEEGLTLQPGEQKQVVVYAKLGQLSSEMTVAFRGEEGMFASRRLRTGVPGPLAGVLPSSATLLVTIGGVPSDALRRLLRGGSVAHVSRLDELPRAWWGYEGVDAVVLTTGDESIASQLAAAGEQLAALELWVRMGGQLVVSVARHAEQLLAPGGPLAALAPGRFDSFVPLRQTSPLETFAETLEPVSTDVRLELTVPKLVDVRGQIEAYAGTGARDLPLVVRTPRGFGEIVFVAFDLDAPPVADWKARPQLLDKLLGRARNSDAVGERNALGEVTTLGFVDLAGQLRGALDQFPGVRLVPFSLVVLLVVLYIACIGPLDYFLVKRVLGRMEATWITFTLTVLVFSGGAFVLAYALKGTDVRVNQLDVVDFDVESGLVRGTSWSNVFSPRIETYDLVLRPEGHSTGAAEAGELFSWFGLSGGAFGGMDVTGQGVGGIDTASRSLPLFTVAYEYAAPGDRIAGVPIAVWSSKALVARWWRTAAGGIEAGLSDEGRLVGTISSKLDVPLEDAVLIYGKWAYVLRRFAAGRTIDVDAFDPQTVDTYLRHVTAVGDRQVAPPYDQESFDVPRIVEVMSAHELAGGRAYTGLANQYQRTSELSRLVRAGRAVLIGRVERPAATLEQNGQPLAENHTERWTYYRYVLPVAVADAD